MRVRVDAGPPPCVNASQVLEGPSSLLGVSVRSWLMACVLGFMWANWALGAWQLSSVQRVKIVNKLQRRNDFGEIHRFKFRKISKCAACTNTKWNVWKIVVNFLVGFNWSWKGEGGGRGVGYSAAWAENATLIDNLVWRNQKRPEMRPRVDW